MLTKRGLNKRGAEGFNVSLIVGIVFAGMGLALALFWVLGGFEWLIGVQKALPGQLEPIAQSCILSAKAGLITTFCKDFKDIEVGKKTQYINCEFSDLKPAIDAAREEETFTTPTCESDPTEEFQFCEDLDALGTSGVSNIKVNGQTCDFHGFGALIISLTPTTTGNMNIGASKIFTIKTERISTIRGNTPSANQALALKAEPSSRGSLDKTAVITGENGEATVTFTAASAGNIVITASLASDPEKIGTVTVTVNPPATPTPNTEGL